MIRKNKQIIVDKGKGDCLRACLTSILGLPNNNDILPTISKDWFIKYSNWFNTFGIELHYE